MNTNPTPYALGPEEGEAFWGFGALWTTRASAEQTGNRFSLIEEVAPGWEGTPLHAHSEDDETFYVLEGEMTFYLGDDPPVPGIRGPIFSLLPLEWGPQKNSGARQRENPAAL